MQAPKIPSFFKTSNTKSFSFKPRYYNKEKERRENLKEGKKAKVDFRKNRINQKEKGRIIRTIFLIILLSLLAYNIIIN